MDTSHMYDRELNVNLIVATVLATVVMGVLSTVLYLVDLSTAWHLTLVIVVAVILLSAILAHGFQAICIQIHASNEYVSRVFSERLLEE